MGLSPTQLIASAGLTENQGITVSGNLTLNITNYNNVAVVKQFMGVVANAIAGNIGNATIANLQTLGASNFPAVTNAIPSSAANVLGNTYTTGFSGYITMIANTETGNGDVSKFTQIFSQSQGYISQANQFLKANEKSKTLATTFTNMDDLTTGGFSSVNSNLQKFGEDLQKLGSLINLKDLNSLGSPAALLKQFVNVAGLTPAIRAMAIAAGATDSQLNSIAKVEFAENVNKALYEGMTKITGDALSQVNAIMKVTTSNISTMADLLNPVKIFPNSFDGFTAPTANGLQKIYVDKSGSVNQQLTTLLPQTYIDLYNTLQKIIPQDQALANKALVASLMQIKGIFNSTLVSMSKAVTSIETNTGLGDINALTTPVPASVGSTLQSQLGSGTGPGNTLVLNDVIGTAAGATQNIELPIVTATMSNLATANAFYTLTFDNGNPNSAVKLGVFTVMNYVLNGAYNQSNPNPSPPPAELGEIIIPAPQPGAGTYGPANSAPSLYASVFDVLIPIAASNISTIATTNSTNVAITTSAFGNMAAQLEREKTNQAKAQIDFANLQPNATSSVLSFASSLASYGKDVEPGQAADYINSVADVSNQTGQAIIASMREARNIAALGAVGVPTDTQL